MCDFVDEKDCLLCSPVPPAERKAFRAGLVRVPLHEPVCDTCLMAWGRNVGFPVSDTDEPAPDEPTAH